MSILSAGESPFFLLLVFSWFSWGPFCFFSGASSHDPHGIGPDLSAPSHPFARSPVRQSQHQLYDAKTPGKLAIYHRPYRVQPADQRARAVPGECLWYYDYLLLR